MSKEKQHIAIRILKVLGWIILGLLILLGGIRLLIKTDWATNLARKKAVAIANESINGTLSINSFKGDLWKELTITDINLIQTDTLLSVDSLNVRYEILSLLSGSFTVNDLKISGYKATIREETKQEFNFQDIVKEDTAAAEEGSGFGFTVENLLMDEGTVAVYSPSYLPDTTLKMQRIHAQASFDIGDEISASLDALSFELKEGRLPDPIKIKTSGSYDDQLITLQEMAIETGRSFFTANGMVNLADTSVNASANTNPLSFADIQPYVEEDLPGENLEMAITASGSRDSLHIKIEADGQGFDELVVISDVAFKDKPVLKKFGLNSKNIDVGYFTNDSVDVHIGEFRASAEGFLSDSLEEMNITWGFSTYDIQYQDYKIKEFFGSGTVIDREVLANIQVSDGNDKIVFHPTISDVFSDQPRWTVPIVVSDVDIGWWAKNPELKSDITFDGFIEGQGYELSDKPWTFAFFKNKVPVSKGDRLKDKYDRINIYSPEYEFLHLWRTTSADTITIGGQKISAFNLNGSVDKDSLKVDGNIKLVESAIKLQADFADFMAEMPTYSYTVSTSEFNLNEVKGIEDFPTSLNFSTSGTGAYFDPEKLELAAKADMDSSIVNGAIVRQLNIDMNMKDGIVRIPEGELISQIIEGNFTARKNINDKTDPENELSFEFQLKNLQPLTPLMDVERLSAKGSITGVLIEGEEDRLQFDGDFDLHDVNYDSLFIAETIQGKSSIGISEFIDFDLDVQIGTPTISEITLQDMNFKTNGITGTDSLNGDFELTINSKDAGRISQSGNYKIGLDSLHADLEWNVFRFVTPVRTLTLQQPFHFSYQSQSIKTDTLVLSSAEGSFLKLAVPYADSLNQEAWIEGQNFDFGVIQEIILGERLVDGVLLGEIEASRRENKLAANGSFQIKGLTYMETEVELMELDFEIENERLTAETYFIIDGEEKITGNLDVPFKLGDPQTFEDAFFEEPVSGKFVVKPTQLSRFENLLGEFDITETKGELSFEGNLSGIAGEPNLNARLSLNDPTLSGIKVDSVFASFEYDHESISLKSVAEIHAKGQRAASINADVPVSIDFKSFEVTMPDETETINVQIKTEDFNLSVFNDFLNKEYMANLRGTLNADLTIEGSRQEMVPNGYVRLKNARISVPVAGITLEDIRSDLQFSEDGLQLNELIMESGIGDFKASGDIKLNGLQPANLDITVRARQFSLANTSKYNLNIDLNGKLNGDPMHPKASGKLTIRNGFIVLDDFGDKSVETVILEGENEINFSPYDSLAMDMQIVIDRDFFVRNSRYLDLEVELTGDLDAVKETGEDLQLFGSLSGVQGYARPLGKLFKLDEAEFTFSGPVEDPRLQIKTSYEPPTRDQEQPVTLYYVIEGTAQEPEFRFESEPQMEQSDIICYTLFGSPCYSLESWQSVFTTGGSASPNEMLANVLLDEIEALATRELGIDVVKIDNSQSGSTSITTGWYLNRRTFFAIVNEISGPRPKPLFILEYMLSKNLDLIISTQDESGQGVDLRWQFDY